VQNQPTLALLRQCHHRLQRRVHRLLGAESVFEDARRPRKSGVRIAAPEMIVERDIGVLPPRQMLQVGKGSGGF
jgi:hypothetical protein